MKMINTNQQDIEYIFSFTPVTNEEKCMVKRKIRKHELNGTIEASRKIVLSDDHIFDLTLL